MISPEENGTNQEAQSLFPASTRVYVDGKLHPELRIPLREISLSETTRPDGCVEENDAVRVYDCSGPRCDPQMY